MKKSPSRPFLGHSGGGQETTFHLSLASYKKIKFSITPRPLPYRPAIGRHLLLREGLRVRPGHPRGTREYTQLSHLNI